MNVYQSVDARQEFELAIGTGKALSDLSPECVRMIRNALPFARSGHDAYLTALERADPLPRDVALAGSRALTDASQPAATAQPDDPEGRLLLNAYGRRCYDAGRESVLSSSLTDALRAQIEQTIADASEIRSACGFMWMRMTVAESVQDAFDVAKLQFETHEPAFKRLETSIPQVLAALLVRDVTPAQEK